MGSPLRDSTYSSLLGHRWGEENGEQIQRGKQKMPSTAFYCHPLSSSLACHLAVGGREREMSGWVEGASFSLRLCCLSLVSCFLLTQPGQLCLHALFFFLYSFFRSYQVRRTCLTDCTWSKYIPPACSYREEAMLSLLDLLQGSEQFGSSSFENWEDPPVSEVPGLLCLVAHFF